MSDGFRDVFRRIDDLGLTVPVGLTLPTEDGTAEIVKTYADCSITAIFYRRAPGSFAIPSVLDPSEIAGGSGGQAGELHVMCYGPVDPDRREITVSFGGFASWDRHEEGVTIPVDRRLTAPFDRSLAGPTPHSERDGVRARVLSMQAGLLRTSVELRIEAADPSILAIQLGRMSSVRGLTGPGPGDLWREWFPPPSPGETVVRRRGGLTSISVSSSFGLTVRTRTPEEIAKNPPPPPPPERPPDWTATTNPGARELAPQGGSERGGPPSVGTQPLLYFDPPEGQDEEIGLSLNGLWSHRFDHARVRVPAPRPDTPVDLRGIAIEGASCRVALERWDATEQGFALHAGVDPPDVWPDIRIIADGSSTSLWTNLPYAGKLHAGLPKSYSPLFAGSELELAMRLVGRTVEPISFALPLTKVQG
jgi:hypothetical protein